MGKIFLRSELERHFLGYAHEFLWEFFLRNNTRVGDEDMQKLARIARILKEMEEGYE